jgi:methylmalonyl-CoA mutase N-terminal domain/subunit
MRELERTCRDSRRNIMPVMMQTLEAEVTLGEVGEIFRQAWGDWRTPPELA